MSISAVVVVHDPVPELERCLDSLRPQVDELVVVANRPGLPLAAARVLENDEPAGYAANANRGVAATEGEFVVLANPDTEAAPGAVALLHEFAHGHPRCGVADEGRFETVVLDFDDRRQLAARLSALVGPYVDPYERRIHHHARGPLPDHPEVRAVYSQLLERT